VLESHNRIVANVEELASGNVFDPSCRIYGDLHRLRIGKHCRIDAFCIISIGEEGIEIGDYVHIAAGVYLYGGGGKITIGDFTFLSPRATLLTSTDDMSGGALVGPTIPGEYRNVRKGPITLEDYAGVATGGVVLPGVTLHTGAVLGALSLAKKDVPPWQVVAGPNQRVVGTRDRQEIESKARRLREKEGTP